MRSSFAAAMELTASKPAKTNQAKALLILIHEPPRRKESYANRMNFAEIFSGCKRAAVKPLICTNPH
jgi:hypothetical protein